jgi:hypothetical protein
MSPLRHSVWNAYLAAEYAITTPHRRELEAGGADRLVQKESVNSTTVPTRKAQFAA